VGPGRSGEKNKVTGPTNCANIKREFLPKTDRFVVEIYGIKEMALVVLLFLGASELGR